MTSDRWDSFVSRLKQEADSVLRNNSDGVAIITAHILVKSDGAPLIWVVQDGKRIEPSKDARSVIAAILGRGGGGKEGE